VEAFHNETKQAQDALAKREREPALARVTRRIEILEEAIATLKGCAQADLYVTHPENEHHNRSYLEALRLLKSFMVRLCLLKRRIEIGGE
jgi:hypothetical protein